MTTYFVSRHPGAVEWAAKQGLVIDQQIIHLDPTTVRSGDTVIGTLPVHLAADVCQRGARYLHLVLDLAADARGRELTASDLAASSARIEPFIVVSPPKSAAII